MDTIIPSRQSPSGAKKRILLVDDDSSLVDVYSELLRSAGFEVTVAYDGQAGWEMLQSGTPPDLVFTGIQMPRLTGFELMQRMRVTPALANIPVVVSSHYGMPEHEAKARELGVTDFIVRGIVSPGHMVDRIRQALGERHRFAISFLRDRADGKALIHFLNQQQRTSCQSQINPEATLEIEVSSQGQVFRVTLRC